ncbi:zinc ribbon domain-containing protein [Methanobrevibacter olleyae]|uniref:Zinc ribbon domain-containing protein n=1 Tax=Methanobrevibacter olleyae TaxID=294671 RepID=A0A126QZQ1_METOL|nr:zinc ribbon domain-containing protein [Methanobrevibacter olleyae]AMK15292.1 hypothetical protein YLM1_0735 [Methanobrevibacter olleyae]
MTKFCSECGFENKYGAKFCKKGGANLEPNNNFNTVNSNTNNNKFKTKHILIICIVAIICVATIGGYLLLNNQGYTLGDNTFIIPESAISKNKTIITENNVETDSYIVFNTTSAKVSVYQVDDIKDSIDLEEEIGFKQVYSNIPFTVYDYCYSDAEASEINDSSFSQYGFVGYFKLNNQYYTISSWSKTSRSDALQPIMDFYRANNQIEDI